MQWKIFPGPSRWRCQHWELVAPALVVHSPRYLCVSYLYGQVHLKPSTSEFAEATLIYLHRSSSLENNCLHFFQCYFAWSPPSNCMNTQRMSLHSSSQRWGRIQVRFCSQSSHAILADTQWSEILSDLRLWMVQMLLKDSRDAQFSSQIAL